jgi:hypothetical protein
MPDLDQLASANPKVDLAKARKALGVVDERRKRGRAGSGYNILSPQNRRLVKRSSRGT